MPFNNPEQELTAARAHLAECKKACATAEHDLIHAERVLKDARDAFDRWQAGLALAQLDAEGRN